MDLGVAFVAGAQAAEVVQVCEAALDNPALASQARAVFAAATGDGGFDAARPQQPAVLVVVIAAVGKHHVGLATRTTDLAGDWPGVQRVEQRQQLRDIVAVAAGQRDRQRDAAGVDEQVML